eukprot:5074114-Amphidinium_carterae.1
MMESSVSRMVEREARHSTDAIWGSTKLVKIAVSSETVRLTSQLTVSDMPKKLGTARSAE